MRIILWMVAGFLVLGATAIVLLLLKGRPSSLPVPKLGLSDLVNLAILVIAVVSLYVAVATYLGASASAMQQTQILDSSRRALDAVVKTAEGQQSVLEKTLETSKTQLALVQAQWQDEQARQARRARLSIISLNGTPWENIQQKHYNVQINLPPAGWQRLHFLLRNTGSIALAQPIYIFNATSDSVFIDGANARGGNRSNHFQLSGITVPDFLPYTVSETDFDAAVNVTVPNDVQGFDLTFKALGGNLDIPLQTTLHVAATDQPQP